MSANLCISPKHLDILQRIFARYGDRIGGVSVFGSRATGRSRPASDIDVVLYGAISDRDYAYLSADFEDSDLPVFVDLVVYDDVTHVPLREHIDRVAIPLPFALEPLEDRPGTAAM